MFSESLSLIFPEKRENETVKKKKNFVGRKQKTVEGAEKTRNSIFNVKQNATDLSLGFNSFPRILVKLQKCDDKGRRRRS